MMGLIFLSFIGYMLLLGARRPFLWVLLYVYIDILAPQRIGFGLIQSIPVSLVAFLAAFGGYLVFDKKEFVSFSWRQGLLLALLAYCFWTTGNADFAESAATKWSWVWKALLFAIFLPFTLTSRLRLEAMALLMVLAIGMIVISTGMKITLGGGGYGNLKFFVDDNSGIYESSTLATVAIALTPLIYRADILVPADTHRHRGAHRPVMHRGAGGFDVALHQKARAVCDRRGGAGADRAAVPSAKLLRSDGDHHSTGRG